MRKSLFSLILITLVTFFNANTLHAAVPQPPYTSKAVSTYIWSVLLPQIVANQSKFATFKDYQNAVTKLQQDYQKATLTTSSQALGAILADAIAVANPGNVPPDVQQAQRIMSDAQSIQTQINQAITTIQNSVQSESSSLSTLSQTIASLNSQVGPNPSPQTQTDLQKAVSDLNAAGSQLSQLQSQNTSLANVKSSTLTQVQAINNLAQQIIGGNNPQGSNLTQLQSLFSILTQYQTSFAQGLQANMTLLVSSLNASLLALSTDVSTLQMDIGGIPNPPPTNTGIGSYIDMGLLSAQLWGFMEYYPVQQMNMTQLDQYLNSLFSQLSTAGVRKIYLSFAQLGSIDSLLAGGVGASTDDVIGQMMISFPGALQEVIKLAHAKGISVDLSFGGENGASMKIVGSSETAQGQAQKLIQFLKTMQIDAVDFDFESTQFTMANSVADSVAFFSTLHQGLTPLGKTSTLTIEGSIYDWPMNFLKSLFYDQTGKLIFFTLFDDLNLMLYSQTEYYIDANNTTWGIEQWMNLLGSNTLANKIHIGFEDNVNYANPNASAGGRYVLDTTNSGTAAGEVFQQLQQALAKDGYSSNLGQPFFWPDISHTAPNTTRGRYEPITSGGVISVNFGTDVMQAFYNKIK